MLLFLRKNAKEISDVTLTYDYDKENSGSIECALEMAGMEFFNVTISMDAHNEDSFSVKKLKGRIPEYIRMRIIRK